MVQAVSRNFDQLQPSSLVGGMIVKALLHL